MLPFVSASSQKKQGRTAEITKYKQLFQQSCWPPRNRWRVSPTHTIPGSASSCFTCIRYWAFIGFLHRNLLLWDKHGLSKGALKCSRHLGCHKDVFLIWEAGTLSSNITCYKDIFISIKRLQHKLQELLENILGAAPMTATICYWRKKKKTPCRIKFSMSYSSPQTHCFVDIDVLRIITIKEV